MGAGVPAARLFSCAAREGRWVRGGGSVECDIDAWDALPACLGAPAGTASSRERSACCRAQSAGGGAARGDQRRGGGGTSAGTSGYAAPPPPRARTLYWYILKKSLWKAGFSDVSLAGSATKEAVSRTFGSTHARPSRSAPGRGPAAAPPLPTPPARPRTYLVLGPLVRFRAAPRRVHLEASSRRGPRGCEAAGDQRYIGRGRVCRRQRPAPSSRRGSRDARGGASAKRVWRG